MNEFFDDNVLLESDYAIKIYQAVKKLPIIDYHCHLDPQKIADEEALNDIGELWLKGDHYKWRAMRMCGVDEELITGSADYKDKFFAYAKIMPKLIGNPLYYWSHFELRQVFGIHQPLCETTAQKIYLDANEKLNKLSTQKLLKSFNVEYIATTDSPADTLKYHGKYDSFMLAPTFRPDKILQFDVLEIKRLEEASKIKADTYTGLCDALSNRLDFFAAQGCKVSDHGFYDFPQHYLTDSEAEAVYKNIETATERQIAGLKGNLLLWLMRQYKKRNIIVQLHFSVVRNVNSAASVKIGVDAGFDVMGSEPDYNSLIAFLDKLPDEGRPTIILYSLNPNATTTLACISGAFRNVYIGAAWWFNDTLCGVKNNLTAVAEYACLGTYLGMLTDSRSFLSYSRFDFFRRILCSFIGEKVQKGEYNALDAEELAKNICYYNIKNLLKI